MIARAPEPPSSQLRFIDNAGVSLAIERHGHGPRRLLFAHGWISSRRMWYDVVERLDPERFTADLLDFRGCGVSDRPAQGYDLDGYASDLRAAIEDAGPAVTVVAHSMGAKVTQYVALTAPAALERMVLVAPGTASVMETSEKHRDLTAAAFGSRSRIERFQRAAMARDVPAETMDRITSDALIAARESWFGWYEHGRTADFSSRLGEITIPTFVLAADKDPLAPAGRVRRLVAAPIRGAVFVALRGVGHNIPVEAPNDVAELLRRID